MGGIAKIVKSQDRQTPAVNLNSGNWLIGENFQTSINLFFSATQYYSS